MTNYATNSQTDKELLEKIDKELAAGHAVLETVTTTAPPATTTTDTKPAKPKRTYLKVSDRMRIIDQFKHGIADPYYSVNPNPKKPGEYIVRKRKTPITYDLTNTTNNFSPQATTAPPATTTTDTNNDTDTTSSDKKSNLGVEFFSVLSSTNASLQRELQSLTDKYNKLDSKLRKERAKRKGQQVTHVSAAAAPATKTKQADNKTKAKTVTDNAPAVTDTTTDNTTNDNEYEYEYEYEYPDEPNTTSQQVSQDVPPQPEVPLRYVPYIRRKQINIYDF